MASENKKIGKKKKDSQIDIKDETFKSGGERLQKKLTQSKKPKIYSVIDLV